MKLTRCTASKENKIDLSFRFRRCGIFLIYTIFSLSSFDFRCLWYRLFKWCPHSYITSVRDTSERLRMLFVPPECLCSSMLIAWKMAQRLLLHRYKYSALICYRKSESILSTKCCRANWVPNNSNNTGNNHYVGFHIQVTWTSSFSSVIFCLVLRYFLLLFIPFCFLSFLSFSPLFTLPDTHALVFEFRF